MAAAGGTLVIGTLAALILDIINRLILNLKRGPGTAMHCLRLCDGAWVDDTNTTLIEESVLHPASNCP